MIFKKKQDDRPEWMKPDKEDKFFVALAIFVSAMVVFALYREITEQNRKEAECKNHYTIKETVCDVCVSVDKNHKYCKKYVEQPCEIKVYKEGYEWCEQ